MKIDFIKPRFVGARFEGHSVPLEVIKGLASYESLVIELAKHLYRMENPRRRRVPRGFLEYNHLCLDGIGEGSAIPQISMVSRANVTGIEEAKHYFEKARDVITECIGATEGPLPLAFPANLLGYFDHMGSHLRDDEALEFPRGTNRPAVFNQVRRQALLEARNKLTTGPFSFLGVVSAADMERRTFRMKTVEGKKVELPIWEEDVDLIRQMNGFKRHHVLLSGTGEMDAWGRLKRTISSNETKAIPNFELAIRLHELKELKDGWFDGDGLAPKKDKLDFLYHEILAKYPDDLAFPAVFPAESGDLLIEWRVKGSPSVDLKLDDWSGYFHAFGPQKEDIEFEQDLSQLAGWERVYQNIRETQKLYQA